MDKPIKIGVIGGSGLYDMPQLTDREEITIDTPFGPPSAPILTGRVKGTPIAFLPRHGRGHIFNPSEVPYKANIYAMKQLGVSYLIASNACGSLREDYAPGHIVIPDQIYDHTRGLRDNTFFKDGLVAHVGTANPFCEELSAVLAASVAEAGGIVHPTGTMITIEGPRFSTRAESNVFRSWGISIIGMTTCPEAFLAREAEISYASISHVTDYDVWHENIEPVTVEKVIATMEANITLLRQSLLIIVDRLKVKAPCTCCPSLRNTFMTAPEKIPSEKRGEIDLIAGKYLG